MASPDPTVEPIELPGNRLAFTTWGHVRGGGYQWRAPDGRSVSALDALPVGEGRLERSPDPVGVRLVVRAARRSGPLIEPAPTHEERGGVQPCSLIADGGRLRLWASTNWGMLTDPFGVRGVDAMAYFESDDGYTWRRPPVGEGGGNLVRARSGCVFIDPAAPPDSRYRLVTEALFTDAECAAYLACRKDDVDPVARRDDLGRWCGLRGSVSADGFRWRDLPDPLVLAHTDSLNVVHWDAARQRYVAYLRDWSGPRAPRGATGRRFEGRRAVGRSESADFASFPLPQVVLDAPPSYGPDDTLYTPCRTAIPGAPDRHLMFPTVWNQAEDSTRVVLAASDDGCRWNLHDAVVLEPGAPGTWDGGCVFPVPNLVELPGGDWALPYTGWDVPHKYPRRGAERRPGWALWPKGRLVGIEAVGSGAFSTLAVVARGGDLLINAETAAGGSLVAELCDEHGAVLPGRSFAEAVPLSGDLHRVPLAWHGGGARVERGRGVSVRLRLERACVYWLELA